jgi:hypothetical protein
MVFRSVFFAHVAGGETASPDRWKRGDPGGSEQMMLRDPDLSERDPSVVGRDTPGFEQMPSGIGQTGA